MGLRWHLMIPRLWRCPGFNVVSVSPLVGRRLDLNESQPLSYKDGRPHFITTTLRIICAPNTQLNAHNTRPLNLTMSAIILRRRSRCFQEFHQSAFPVFIIGQRTPDHFWYWQEHCRYHCWQHAVQPCRRIRQGWGLWCGRSYFRQWSWA